jgi:hypothetical protein
MQNLINNGTLFFSYLCYSKAETFVPVSGSDLQLNTTINGTEGFLTSPNFPGNYYHNLDYWVQLIGPERTRLVIEFKQLDLELQTECLYDFVELRSIDGDGQLLNDAVRWCGNHYLETDKYVHIKITVDIFLILLKSRKLALYI